MHVLLHPNTTRMTKAMELMTEIMKQSKVIFNRKEQEMEAEPEQKIWGQEGEVGDHRHRKAGNAARAYPKDHQRPR